MKYLYIHKTKIVYVLFIVALIFKFAVIQEYVHIEQHKKEQSSHANCLICHNIFHAGKNQAFEVPEILAFSLLKYSDLLYPITTKYIYIFQNDINRSELYNRPPPQIA